MVSEYPYENDYSFVPPPLRRDAQYPITVLSAHMVESAMQLLDGGQCVLHAEESAEILLDFGNECVGDVCLSAVGKGNITVLYGEMRGEVFADPALARNGWYEPPKDSFHADGIHNFTSAGRRGFRYIRLLASGGTLALSDLRVINERYATLRRGSFLCADDTLNEVYRMCERTMRLCMQRFYEDGVKRDGLLWLGDTRVMALNAYALYGDVELMRQSLMRMARTQRSDGFIPACSVRGGGFQHPERIEYMFGGKDLTHEHLKQNQGCEIMSYCADFVSSLWEYCLYSGDMHTVSRLLPCARRLMDYLCDGLREGELLQPASFRKKIPEDSVGELCAYYACLYMAIQDYASLLSALGTQDARTKAWEDAVKTRIQTLYTSYDGLLYSPDKGCYPCTAQAFGVLRSLITKENAKRFFESALTNPLSLKPWSGLSWYWTLRGMCASDCGVQALSAIRQTWGTMLREGADTCWEGLFPEALDEVLTQYRQSRCHGWSACPADIFTREILGYEPLTPGGKKARVRPCLFGLAWAEGTIPTPSGDVFIHVSASGTVVKTAGDIEITLEV